MPILGGDDEVRICFNSNSIESKSSSTHTNKTNTIYKWDARD
jgi:hypothetical protein